MSFLTQLITVSSQLFALYQQQAQSSQLSKQPTAYQARDLATIDTLRESFHEAIPNTPLPDELSYYHERSPTIMSQTVAAPNTTVFAPYCHLPDAYSRNGIKWGNNRFLTDCQQQVALLQEAMTTLNRSYRDAQSSASSSGLFSAPKAMLTTLRTPPDYGYPNDAIRMTFSLLMTTWITLSGLDLNDPKSLEEATGYFKFLERVVTNPQVTHHCDTISNTKTTQIALMAILNNSFEALQALTPILTDCLTKRRFSTQSSLLRTNLQALIANHFQYSYYIVSDDAIDKTTLFLTRPGMAASAKTSSCLVRWHDQVALALREANPDTRLAEATNLTASETRHRDFQTQWLVNQETIDHWPAFDVLKTEKTSGFCEYSRFKLNDFSQFGLSLYRLGLLGQSLYHFNQLLTTYGDQIVPGNHQQITRLLTALTAQVMQVTHQQTQLNHWARDIVKDFYKKDYDMSKPEQQWRANFQQAQALSRDNEKIRATVSAGLTMMTDYIKRYPSTVATEQPVTAWQSFLAPLEAVERCLPQTVAMPALLMSASTVVPTVSPPLINQLGATQPVTTIPSVTVTSSPVVETISKALVVREPDYPTEALVTALKRWVIDHATHPSAEFTTFWTAILTQTTPKASRPLQQQRHHHHHQLTYTHLTRVAELLTTGTSRQQQWAEEELQRIAAHFIRDANQTIKPPTHYFRHSLTVTENATLASLVTTVGTTSQAFLDFLLTHTKPTAVNAYAIEPGFEETLTNALRALLQKKTPGSPLTVWPYMNALKERLYPRVGQTPDTRLYEPWNALLNEVLVRWSHACVTHSNEQGHWQTIAQGLVRLGANPLPWLCANRQDFKYIISDPKFKALFLFLIEQTDVVVAFIDFQAPYLGGTLVLLDDAITQLTDALTAFSDRLAACVKSDDALWWRFFPKLLFDGSGARDERAQVLETTLAWYYTLLYDTLLLDENLDNAIEHGDENTDNAIKHGDKRLKDAQAMLKKAQDAYGLIPRWKCFNQGKTTFDALRHAVDVIVSDQEKVIKSRQDYRINARLKAQQETLEVTTADCHQQTQRANQQTQRADQQTQRADEQTQRADEQTQRADEQTQRADQEAQEKQQAINSNLAREKKLQARYQTKLLTLVKREWQGITLPRPLTSLLVNERWDAFKVTFESSESYLELCEDYTELDITIHPDWSALQEAVLSRDPRLEKLEVLSPSASPRSSTLSFFNPPPNASTTVSSSSSTSTAAPPVPHAC